MGTRMTRRNAGRILLAAPLAAAASPLGKFLSKQATGLSGDERVRVRRDVASLEEALRTVRAFALDNDVPPAGGFSALRSKRG